MLQAGRSSWALPLTIDQQLQTPARQAGALTVLDVPLQAEVVAGQLNTVNAQGTLAALESGH
jgi:hypothetical protein